MAKKKAAKKNPTGAKKANPAKKSKKTPPARAEESMELKLDSVEQQAVHLVSTSDQLCDELEKAVTAAVTNTVQKVYKKHKLSLSAAQAENVALLLFGD